MKNQSVFKRLNAEMIFLINHHTAGAVIGRASRRTHLPKDNSRLIKCFRPKSVGQAHLIIHFHHHSVLHFIHTIQGIVCGLGLSSQSGGKDNS